MARIFLAVIASMSVLAAASFSLAGYEIEMEGVVTAITATQLTIKDDKGKETTIEGKGDGIKVGDWVLLKGQIAKSAPVIGLTTQDIDFLAKQCQVSHADIDIVSRLSKEAQAEISTWVTARDRSKLGPFKASRDYYRQLQYEKPIPLPPPGWNCKWLTEEEFKRYGDILTKAPW